MKEADRLVFRGEEAHRVYCSTFSKSMEASIGRGLEHLLILELGLLLLRTVLITPLTGFLCFYVAQRRLGYVFLILDFYVEVVTLFKVLLNQLTPKSLSPMASYAILVLYQGKDPTVE